LLPDSRHKTPSDPIRSLYKRQHELPRPYHIMFRKPLEARLQPGLVSLQTGFHEARVEQDSDMDDDFSNETSDAPSDDDAISTGSLYPDPDELL
jgi:hypothetical protein